MATFLNPALIADSVPEPQPVPGPIAMAEGVGRVRQLQQQNQQQTGLYPIAQEQAQANLSSTQADVAEKEQKVKDQAAFGKAMQDSGGDPDKLEAMAGQTITDPWTLSRVQNTASMIRQRNATMTAAQNKATADLHSQFSGRLQSVIDAKGPEQAALWQQTVADAMAAKDPSSGKPLLPPGLVDPSKVPPPEAIQNLQTYLNGSNDYQLRQAKAKEEAAVAARNTTTAQTAARQEMRAEIANKYNGVQTSEDHAQFLEDIKKQYPDVAGEYANLPYDADSTPKLIESMALAPKDRAMANARQTTADAAATKAQAYATSYGGRAGLAARANDPKISDEDRAAAKQALADYDLSVARGGASPPAQLMQQRYLQKRQDADQKLHGTIEEQKQSEQGYTGRYSAVLAKAGIDENTKDATQLAQTVKDPRTGRDISAGEAIAALQASRGKVAGYIASQDQIEKRQQWGKYAPTPTTPPPVTAAPPTATPAPAPRAVPAGQPAPAAGGPAKTTKTFPRARLESYAKASNSSPEQAETYLKSKGYVIQ